MGTVGNDWVCAMSAAGSGNAPRGLMLAGYTDVMSDAFSRRYHALVMKTDDNGFVIWHTLYPASNKLAWNAKAKAMTVTSGGACLITGWIDKGAGNKLFVVKYACDESSTAIQWEKTLPAFDGWSITEISEGAAAKRFIVIAGTAGNGRELDLYVAKLDENGNIGARGTWQKTYSNFPGNSVGLSIRQICDRGYIVTGGTGDDPYPDRKSGSALFLFRLDARGNPTWKKPKVFFGDTAIHAQGYAVIEIPGGLLVTGVCDGKVIVLKTGYDGTVRGKTWPRVYDGEIEGKWKEGHRIEMLYDTAGAPYYLIAGYTERGGYYGNDVFIMRTDTAGTIQNGYPKYIGRDRDDGVVDNEILVGMVTRKEGKQTRCIVSGSTTSKWPGSAGGIDFSLHSIMVK